MHVIIMQLLAAKTDMLFLNEVFSEVLFWRIAYFTNLDTALHNQFFLLQCIVQRNLVTIVTTIIRIYGSTYI